MEQVGNTYTEKHLSSLRRIADCCEIPLECIQGKNPWELEQMILMRLDKGKVEKKRGLATIKKLQREIEGR